MTTANPQSELDAASPFSLRSWLRRHGTGVAGRLSACAGFGQLFAKTMQIQKQEGPYENIPGGWSNIGLRRVNL